MMTDEEIAVRLALALIEKKEDISAIEAVRLYDDCLKHLRTTHEAKRSERGRRPQPPQAEM